MTGHHLIGRQSPPNHCLRGPWKVSAGQTLRDPHPLNQTHLRQTERQRVFMENHFQFLKKCSSETSPGGFLSNKVTVLSQSVPMFFLCVCVFFFFKIAFLVRCQSLGFHLPVPSFQNHLKLWYFKSLTVIFCQNGASY